MSSTSLPSNFVCGSGFSVCIDENDNVWYVGKNHFTGENNLLSPYYIKSLENIVSISCGNAHIVCSNIEGKVWTFGINSCNQLGYKIEFNNFISIPKQIEIPPIDQVHCGNDFTICKTFSGTLWAFGDNKEGELGLGNNNECFFPTEIPNIDNVNILSCGGFFTICSTFNNEFYSWGKGTNGQLANNTNLSTFTPTNCTKYIPKDIISIKSADGHSVFLTNNGIIYTCGKNLFGRLGIGNNSIQFVTTPTLIKGLPFIKYIECGILNTKCIDIDDNLWVFGCNVYGELGMGTKNNENAPKLNTKISNVLGISRGGFHTFYKTYDNKIYSCGENVYGQITIEEGTQVISATQVLKDKEDLWKIYQKNKQKSARK